MTLISWLCLSVGLGFGMLIGERMGYSQLRKTIRTFVDEAYRLAGLGDRTSGGDDQWWREGRPPPDHEE